MDEIDIANGDARKNSRTEAGCIGARVRFLDRLTLGRDLEDRHLDPLLVHVAVEVASDKTVMLISA